MPSDYGYLNARIRGMKSRLFDRRLYSELLAKANLDDLLASLAQTGYGDAFQAALSRHVAWDALRDGLRRDLTAALLKVRVMTMDEPDAEPARLVSILLMRWDRRNLLAVMRMQYQGPEATRALELLVPVGDVDEIALGELLRQPNLRDAIDLAVTWGLPYGHGLRNAWPSFAETGNLAVLESALDQRYAGLVGERLAALPPSASVSLVQRVLNWEFDTYNLLNVLRVWAARRPGDPSGEEAPAWYLRSPGASPANGEKEGNAIPEAALAAAISSTEAAGVVASLADSPGISSWLPSLTEWADHGSLTALQKALERRLTEMAVSLFHRDPLTAAPIIAFLWAKENEVRNLRLIGLVVGHDLPRERALEDMYVPW